MNDKFFKEDAFLCLKLAFIKSRRIYSSTSENLTCLMPIVFVQFGFYNTNQYYYQNDVEIEGWFVSVEVL